MSGRRAFTQEEFTRLAHFFQERDMLRERALLYFGCLCGGFRISETLSLRIGDLVQGGRLVKWVTVARKSMKGRRASRTAMVHPSAVPALTTWLQELHRLGYMGKRDYLFQSLTTDANRPISRVRAWALIKQACAACGIVGRTGTHSLRKTFASIVHEASGRDLLQVKAALNHSDITSTQRYLEIDLDRVEQTLRGITWK